MAEYSVTPAVVANGTDNDHDSAHMCKHLNGPELAPTSSEQRPLDQSETSSLTTTSEVKDRQAEIIVPSLGKDTEPELRNPAEAVEIDPADQAVTVKPEATSGAEAGESSPQEPDLHSSPQLPPLRCGGRRFTVTRLEELPPKITVPGVTATYLAPGPCVDPVGADCEEPPQSDGGSVAGETGPDWDWDSPTPPAQPQPEVPLTAAAAVAMRSSYASREGVPLHPGNPAARVPVPGSWGVSGPLGLPAHPGHPAHPGLRGVPGHAGHLGPSNYATVQGAFSAPLLRHLMSPNYQPSHTISYGHSDGRHLTVRRLLDWEVPDLHTVRKYASESDLDSISTQSVVPTHRDRGRRYRRTWTNKVEFVLACLGYAVGLSNLWRFPYLCYKSGGGAFLIPYLIMMFVCSISLLLMELIVGQFTRQGPVGAISRLCPLLKGAGLAPVIVSFLFCTYYNVVIAWALFYLFSSFAADVPWKHCNNTWNEPTCEDVTVSNKSMNATTPSEEFFNHRVLELTKGVEDLGTLRLPLILTLVLAWVLVYFSIWKSIRSSGKVVYFTVIAPYLLLFAFLWRALTLEGASSGVRFLFEPRWHLLKDPHVWVNAAAQNFNSVGIGYGPMITFASYNKFNNRSLLMDTFIICSVNLLTSVVAGVIVFATLGNLAMELHRPIENVVVDGPGLVYVTYPKALASMPVTQLWAVLFFVMLLCLGLDSQFATLEVVITSLEDAYGNLVRRYLRRHEILVLVICLVSLGLGLPYVTQGGMYLFQLMDYHVANNSLMLLALFEVVAVSWIYGTDRLSQDYYTMTGKRPSIYFRFCWKFLAPVVILVIWVLSVIDHKRATYGSYVYPEWASRLGWVLAMLPVLPIPVCAVLAIWRAPGKTLMERMKASVQPDRRVRSEVGFEPTVGGPDDMMLGGFDYELQPVTGGQTIHPGHAAYMAALNGMAVRDMP